MDIASDLYKIRKTLDRAGALTCLALGILSLVFSQYRGYINSLFFGFFLAYLMMRFLGQVVGTSKKGLWSLFFLKPILWGGTAWGMTHISGIKPTLWAVSFFLSLLVFAILLRKIIRA